MHMTKSKYDDDFWLFHVTKYAVFKCVHLSFASLVKQNVDMAASFGFLICKLWEWLSTVQLCVCVYLPVYTLCVCVCVHLCTVCV